MHILTFPSVALCISATISTHKGKFVVTWMTAAAGEPLFVTDLQPSKKTPLPENRETEQDWLVSINVAGKHKHFPLLFFLSV